MLTCYAWEGLHFCAGIKCSSDDERPCDTVDGIGKCARVMIIFESNGTRPDAARADANGQDEEREQCQHFDTVDGTLASRPECNREAHTATTRTPFHHTLEHPDWTALGTGTKRSRSNPTGAPHPSKTRSQAKSHYIHSPESVGSAIYPHNDEATLTVTQRYQYAHPSPKANESSTNRCAYSVNDPETGMAVASSPSDCLLY